MSKLTDQISFADIDPHYQAFIDKFKPKKTTDDCYTPDSIFDIVKAYVFEHYGVTEDRIVRPFWPGMDYRDFDYPEGCVVVDNPPFSILSRIIQDFNTGRVQFFLFEPYLTAFSLRGCTHIITASEIVYENGAKVPSSFCTSLEPGVLARSDPELARKIKAESERLQKLAKKQVPKYLYPDNVLTASDLGYMAVHNTAFTVHERDAHYIRMLDAQESAGKAIFGNGYLMSTALAAERAAAERAAAERAAAERAAAERAAAERAAAYKWTLSKRELDIIAQLDKRREDANETKL